MLLGIGLFSLPHRSDLFPPLIEDGPDSFADIWNLVFHVTLLARMQLKKCHVADFYIIVLL